MKVGFPSLELNDLLSYSPVIPPSYPQEPCLKFVEYKTSISILLMNFFEDIVTLHEKVVYLEQIVGKSLKDVSKADLIADDLKASISNKLGEVAAGFADGLIQDRAGIIRMDTSSHSTEIPKDLNLEYIQQYLRNKLAPVLPSIFQNFYKAPSGINDGKMVSLLQKVGRLEEFIRTFTPDNALSRVSIHFLELVHVLFAAGVSREEVIQRIPMLMTFDMRQLLENVIQGGGKQWMANPAIISASVVNRDVVIDKIKEMAVEKPEPKLLNLENLFRLKMVRDKVEMKHEILHHTQKAFEIYNGSEERSKISEDVQSSCKHIKDLLAVLRSYLTDLCTSTVGTSPITDLMKNSEEGKLKSMLASPQTGTNLRDVIEGSLQRPGDNQFAFKDHGVIRAYQDVIRGLFTPEVIAAAQPSISNLQKFSDFERLTMCIVRCYELMDDILETLKTKHKQVEKNAYLKITKSVMDRVSDSLNSKFYYKLDIFRLIDDIFHEIEDLLKDQAAIRSELDATQENNTKAAQLADREKKLKNKKMVECGVSKLSDLIKMPLTRLLPKPVGDGMDVFDSTSFEDSLRDNIRRAVTYGGSPQDRYVYFYVNDKRKKPFDFFKILYLQVQADLSFTTTQICCFDSSVSSSDKESVFFNDYKLENNPSSILKHSTAKLNNIEVLCDDELEYYDITSKLLVTIYYLIFKQFGINGVKTDHYSKFDQLIPKVVLASEHLFDFLSFVRSGYVGARPSNQTSNNHLSLSTVPLGGSVVMQNPSIRYSTHHSLLDIYGSSAAPSSSRPLHQNYMHTSDTTQPSQAQLGSRLQQLLDNSSKVVSVREQEARALGLLSYSTGVTHQTSVGDDREAQLLRIRRDKEERERLEKDKREERERIEKEKREKEELLWRDRQEKEKKEREAREAARKEKEAKEREEREMKDKKLREEKEARDKENKERYEREDRERREREERDRAAREEKARLEREEREKKDRELKERIDREDKERRERDARERQEREERDKRDREERENKDREEREKREQKERERREQDEKDRAARELSEAEARAARDKKLAEEKAAMELKDKQLREQKEKEDRERREKEEQERLDKEIKDRADREAREKADREAEELRIKQAREQDEQRRLAAEAADKKRKEDEEERIRLEKEAEQKRKEQDQKQAEEAESRRLAEEESLKKRAELDEFDDLDFGAKKVETKADAPADVEDDFFEDFDIEASSPIRKPTVPAKKVDKQPSIEMDASNAKPNKVVDQQDDFFDDFDDMDDFTGSIGKKSAAQTQPKKAEPAAQKEKYPETKKGELDEFDDFDDFGQEPSPKKVVAAEISTEPKPQKPETQVAQPSQPKKRIAADDEFEFDDDDFGDLLDEEPKPAPKKTEPAKPSAPEPKKITDTSKEDELAVDEFAPEPKKEEIKGGIMALKRLASNKLKDAPAAQTATGPTENKRKETRLIKSADTALITEFLTQVHPISEEEVHLVMGNTQFDTNVLQALFNDWVSTKTVFFLEFQETDDILMNALDNNDNPQEFQAKVQDVGSLINQVLVQTFNDQPDELRSIQYFFAPFQLVEGLEDLMVVFAVYDVANKTVLLASIAPGMQQDLMRESPMALAIANSLSQTVNQAVFGKPMASLTKENIIVPTVSDGLGQFLEESCEDPMLRYVIMSYLVLYEPVTDVLNLEGFKSSLEIEEYNQDHAIRFVLSIRNSDQANKLRLQIQETPEMTRPLMMAAGNLVAEKKADIVIKLADQIIPEEEIAKFAMKDIQEILERKEEGFEKVFAVLEYCPDEAHSISYLICIDDVEPNLVVGSTVSVEPLNSKILEEIKSAILRSGRKKLQVYAEHPRNLFMKDQLDYLIYTWTLQACDSGLSPLDALRCVCYNEAACVYELMAGLEIDAEEEEVDPEQAMIQGEDSLGKEEGGEQPEDFGDIDLDDDDFGAKKAPPEKPSKAAQAAVKSKMNYDHEFDDFDDDIGKDGGDGGANFDDLDDLDF